MNIKQMVLEASKNPGKKFKRQGAHMETCVHTKPYLGYMLYDDNTSANFSISCILAEDWIEVVPE